MSQTRIRSITRVILLLGIGGAALFVLAGCGGPAMSDGPGMLFFYSPTCPICQSMKPIMEEIEQTYGDEFNVVRIDVTTAKGEQTARELGLIGQPNYVFFDTANEETRRLAGPQTYEVLAQEIERTLGE